jgi:hypothetical protein
MLSGLLSSIYVITITVANDGFCYDINDGFTVADEYILKFFRKFSATFYQVTCY